MHVAGVVHAFLPVAEHTLSVGEEVVVAQAFLVPFAHVVAQHRLAVARSHVHLKPACHFLAALLLEERCGAFVHGGPDGIGAQTQQQFEHLLVGLGSNVATRPGAQTPVLVVQEDTAILHRWLLQGGERVGRFQSLALLRHHVAPPCPGRDACHAREFQDAVGRGASFVAHHHEPPVVHTDVESILAGDDLLVGQPPLLQFLEFLVRQRAQFDNLQPAFAVSLGMVSRHGLHVVVEHAQGGLHHRRIVLLRHVAHVRVTVVPDNIASTGQGNKVTK